MSIDDIKKFSDWVRQGDSTLQQRFEMFSERKAVVEKIFGDYKLQAKLLQKGVGTRHRKKYARQR